MGNWQEDRQAVKQPQNLDRDQRQVFYLMQVRHVEQSISVPAIRGQMVPLPRIARAHRWITKNVIIPDDGFVRF